MKRYAESEGERLNVIFYSFNVDSADSLRVVRGFGNNRYGSKRMEKWRASIERNG